MERLRNILTIVFIFLLPFVASATVSQDLSKCYVGSGFSAGDANTTFSSGYLWFDSNYAQTDTIYVGANGLTWLIGVGDGASQEWRVATQADTLGGLIGYLDNFSPVGTYNIDAGSIALTSCGGGGGGGGTTSQIQPSGTVWAISALSIIMVAIVVYFMIFWMLMYTIFYGIARFFRSIFVHL